MHEAEFHEHVGEENICHSVADALDRAKILYPEVAKQLPAGTTWGRRSTDERASRDGIGGSADLSTGKDRIAFCRFVRGSMAHTKPVKLNRTRALSCSRR